MIGGLTSRTTKLKNLGRPKRPMKPRTHKPKKKTMVVKRTPTGNRASVEDAVPFIAAEVSHPIQGRDVVALSSWMKKKRVKFPGVTGQAPWSLDLIDCLEECWS